MTDAPTIVTIDQAIDALDAEIERCLTLNDPCGYFAVVYRAVTARVRDGIAAGEFADGARMERFDVLFARRYLDAAAGWQAGTEVPAVWRVAFETGSSRRHLAAQHLLLGINAHINLDLGIAAALATEPGDIDSLRDDFERINDVLAELVDRMQRAISSVSFSARAIDVVGLRLDEALVTFSLRHARAAAWEFASVLSSQPPSGRAALEAQRDREMTELAHRIARPGWPLRWVVSIARFRERHDLARVVAEMAT
ncbi:MAG: DUF5995 family protein [Acidimicrobiales bacterium]